MGAPNGSICDMHSLSVFLMIANDVFGRGIGPPGARWAIAHGGRLWFSWAQVIVCGAFFLMVELLLCFDEEDDSVSSKDPSDQVSTCTGTSKSSIFSKGSM